MHSDVWSWLRSLSCQCSQIWDPSSAFYIFCQGEDSKHALFIHHRLHRWQVQSLPRQLGCRLRLNHWQGLGISCPVLKGFGWGMIGISLKCCLEISEEILLILFGLVRSVLIRGSEQGPSFLALLLLWSAWGPLCIFQDVLTFQEGYPLWDTPTWREEDSCTKFVWEVTEELSNFFLPKSLKSNSKWVQHSRTTSSNWQGYLLSSTWYWNWSRRNSQLLFSSLLS